MRTVYRDLRAIDEEIGVPVWAEGGLWGVDADKAFLPPLKLTQSEAMAVVLSARLMVRYADKYDPDLAAAFEKLAVGLPPALGEHVERTLDIMSTAPRDPVFNEHVRLLTKAWAERRVVTIDYQPARYDGGASPRRATVRPYLIEPSLQTHALYLMGFDEERGAIRTFKIERIARGGPDAADLRAARSGRHDRGAAAGLGHHRGPGTDDGRAALHARTSRHGSWRPAGTRPRPPRPPPTARCSGGSPSPARSRSGSGSCRGATTSRSWSPRACGSTSRPRTSRAAAQVRSGNLVKRHQFAAVNLISDPIHGYVELTKRLTRDESAAIGLPDEEVAEQDVLDTTWLQRLRRISQLQSARWVFPTAEHSRFTHGLGVMHEAGLLGAGAVPEPARRTGPRG